LLDREKFEALAARARVEETDQSVLLEWSRQ
jgi:hypothetical protein